MEYRDIIQIPLENTDIRFSLLKEGKNVLIVIGFNPSTADKDKKDPTMGSVLYHAENNGYDGFVMLNLYPLRSTSPDKLPNEIDPVIHQQNIKHINSILSKYPESDILLAYGNLVHKRRYTKHIANEIKSILKENKRRTLCLYKLKTGNPKHPLRAYGKITFQPYEL